MDVGEVLLGVMGRACLVALRSTCYMCMSVHVASASEVLGGKEWAWFGLLLGEGPGLLGACVKMVLAGPICGARRADGHAGSRLDEDHETYY